MPHRTWPFCLGLLLLALPLVAQAGPAQDPGAAFAGQPGTFVLRWPDGRIWRHDPQRAAARFSPCSTFKIPNALIGLDSGVIPGPGFVLPWDGKQRTMRSEWNRDHDLGSAIRYSVLWYFQELARRVGAARMQAYLDRIDYGNRDLSGGIDRFWLGSSLTISADEQVEFLLRLYDEKLPLDPARQRQVKEMLVLERKGGAVLSGKTGSGRQEGRWTVGWFVGWLERGGQTYVFACRVEADSTREAPGGRAREVAEAVLRAWELW